MGKLTRFAGAATAAALLMLLVPATASAGGPTSVLLVSPARQATASLYTTDEAYTRLLRLVGENPTAEQGAPSLQGGPGSDAINVTWLVHDVQIWRVDRIFTDAAGGGPWVQTIMLSDGRQALESAGVMHRAADGKELIALLSAMRLLGTSPVSVFQGPKAEAPATGVNAVASVGPVEPKPAELDWLWLVIGTAAGATLVVGFRPLLRRLRPS